MVNDYSLFRTLLKNVEAELDLKVIYLIFNEGKEIDRMHIPYIRKFITKLRYDKVIVILEGIGGDSIAGRLLALDLLYKFNSGYYVAIPNFAQSALVFSIFPALTLFMDNKGYIGPTEPLIRRQINNCIRFESCVNLMKNGTSKEKRKATLCWTEQANFILDLFKLSEGSIIHNNQKLSIDQIESISRLFLCSHHNRKITKQELKRIGFYCYDVEGKDFWLNIKKFTDLFKSELIKDRTKIFVIGDSNSELFY